MTERPDYIVCIREDYGERPNKTLCGKPLSFDFYFNTIDHAYFNGRSKGRLLPCPECAQVVLKLFTDQLRLSLAAMP